MIITLHYLKVTALITSLLQIERQHIECKNLLIGFALSKVLLGAIQVLQLNNAFKNRASKAS